MGGKRKEFREDQLKWLKENYDNKGMVELEVYLGSSAKTINRALGEMGLYRAPKNIMTPHKKMPREEEKPKWVDVKMEDRTGFNSKIERCKQKARETGKVFGRKVLAIHTYYCLVKHPNGYRECYLWSDIATKVRG